MAASSRLAIWPTVIASYRLAWEAFIGLREATLIAIGVELAIDLTRLTISRDQMTQGVVRTVLGALAAAGLMSPYAVLLHRRVVLGEPDRNYVHAILQPRTVRFAVAAMALSAVSMPVALLMIRSKVAGADADAARVLQDLMLSLLWAIGVTVLLVRAFLAFPAIAIDDSPTPLADSLRATRGSAWRIFGVFIVAGLVLAPAELFFEWLFRASGGVIGSAGRAVVATFEFALLVAIASHLYATRADWSAAARPPGA
jgi:hypothetical protein